MIPETKSIDDRPVWAAYQAGYDFGVCLGIRRGYQTACDMIARGLDPNEYADTLVQERN
jgi:hypothetical protein